MLKRETYKIIYPETKIVSGDIIDRWYDDAVSNAELDEDDTYYTSTLDKAKALDNAGIITLIKDVVHESNNYIR